MIAGSAGGFEGKEAHSEKVIEGMMGGICGVYELRC